MSSLAQVRRLVLTFSRVDCNYWISQLLKLESHTHCLNADLHPEYSLKNVRSLMFSDDSCIIVEKLGLNSGLIRFLTELTASTKFTGDLELRLTLSGKISRIDGQLVARKD